MGDRAAGQPEKGVLRLASLVFSNHIGYILLPDLHWMLMRRGLF